MLVHASSEFFAPFFAPRPQPFVIATARMAHAEDGARESSDAPLETAGIKYPSGFRRFVIVLGILFGVFVVRESNAHLYVYTYRDIYI